MKLIAVCALVLLACDSSSPADTTPRTCERTELSVVRDALVWSEVDTFDGDRRVRTVRTAHDTERASDSVVAFSYDAKGRVLREDHDDGANDSIDWTETWTYDANDWTLRVSTWPIWCVSHERVLDAAGRVLTERVDDFGNGTWDLVAENTWRDGRLVERHEATATEPADKTIMYTYDAAGRNVRESHDVGDDGGADYLVTRDYDAAGRLAVVARRDPDGTWVEGMTFERDADGLVQATEWDSTLDGVERVTYQRDADGNVLTQELTYGDDTRPTTRWTFTSGCAQRVDVNAP